VTRDEHDNIFRMAHEAGLRIAYTEVAPWLVRYTALVAAAEREACALIAESYEPRCDICPSGVATAIRARDNT
jgi:hypothetical protein